jgi:hypothetical protein
LNEAVFVNENGTNAMGDKPAGLMQAYWDTGNRRVIPWDVINRLAEDDPPSNGEDNIKGVVNAVNATSVEEGNVNTTSSEAKSARLAKLVKLAKSTALWCLSPYITLLQEAKDKQRKVCPVNLQGEVCRAKNCSNKHPKVCLVADHGKGKIPKATCTLWLMLVPFAGKSQGNFTRKRSGPSLPQQQGEQQQQCPAGQAGQVPCQARGGVPCRGAQGEDQRWQQRQKSVPI